MALKQLDYLHSFEMQSQCVNNCWIVIRIDGSHFHRFTELHKFDKPNDLNGLNLMTNAAVSVLQECTDISLAFGQSDEFSFILNKNTTFYNRRKDKLITLINSIFSSSYVFFWEKYFPNKKLLCAPSFDARIILYPSNENLRDYLSWRQADVHVNNLYNTCFWALVLKGGLMPDEAETKLQGTLSKHKNELLFKDFNINYNNEPEIFRKGTVLIRKRISVEEGSTGKTESIILPLHCDIINDDFWNNHPEILEQTKAPLIKKSDIDKYYSCETRTFF